MLSDRQVDAAVAEKFGPKIMGALKERGIRACTMKGAAKLAPAKIRES